MQAVGSCLILNGRERSREGLFQEEDNYIFEIP